MFIGGWLDTSRYMLIIECYAAVKSEEVGYRSIPYYGVNVLSNAKSKMDKMCVVCTYSSKKVGNCDRPNNGFPNYVKPNPLNLKYVTLHGKKDFSDVVKLRTFRWEIVLDSSGRPSVIPRIKIEAEEGS